MATLNSLPLNMMHYCCVCRMKHLLGSLALVCLAWSAYVLRHCCSSLIISIVSRDKLHLERRKIGPINTFWIWLYKQVPYTDMGLLSVSSFVPLCTIDYSVVLYSCAISSCPCNQTPIWYLTWTTICMSTALLPCGSSEGHASQEWKSGEVRVSKGAKGVRPWPESYLAVVQQQ